MKRNLIKGIIALSMLNSCAVGAQELSKEPISNSQWFASFGIGAHFPDYTGAITVENGVGLPPNNLDLYSTQDDSNGVIAIAAGKRWTQNTDIIPSYSLSLMYQHFFAVDAGGLVTQYSLPQFTNYDYSWDLSSDMILLAGKVNVYRAGQFSPFVGLGLGFAFNETDNYSESALPNVTPRISPSFASHTNTDFAYQLSIGLDYQCSDQWIVSLAYLYQDLGEQESGPGTNAWASSHLNLGSYTASEVLLSVHYLWG